MDETNENTVAQRGEGRTSESLQKDGPTILGEESKHPHNNKPLMCRVYTADKEHDGEVIKMRDGSIYGIESGHFVRLGVDPVTETLMRVPKLNKKQRRRLRREAQSKVQ